MKFIGIDPGSTGAVAILHETGVVQFFDTPTIAVVRNGKNHNEYDPHGMADIFVRNINDEKLVYVCVEKVNAMPAKPDKDGNRQSMGATSAFNFGKGFGMWQGILAALGLRYELVHPATWKKLIMPGMDKAKGASVIRASQLYPQAASMMKLVKHHGRGDALLLAEFGRRTYSGPAKPLEEPANLFTAVEGRSF